MSSPAAPNWSEPRPSRRCAPRGGARAIVDQRVQVAVADRVDVPPRPPSPPSGRRRMNFSRRKPTQPLPPLPAATSMVASSTNFMGSCACCRREWYGIPGPASNKAPVDRGFAGRAAACAAARSAASMLTVTVQRTLDGELHLRRRPARTACGPCPRRRSCRVELGAALAHDDRAGRHALAAIGLHAQHLRLRITAVSGRAAALFLCHVLTLDLVSG